MFHIWRKFLKREENGRENLLKNISSGVSLNVRTRRFAVLEFNYFIALQTQQAWDVTKLDKSLFFSSSILKF